MSAAIDAVSRDFPVPLVRPDVLERLEADLTELWGHINAANYRFLKRLAEFDRLKGYEAHGLASSAQWLSWQCGIRDNAARERVRVARALEFLPRISDAFRRGMLSYSKVRAVTRVARPEDEEILLNAAMFGSAAQVERLVCKFRRRAQRNETSEADARHEDRYLNIYDDENGAVVIHAVLPPEVGAVVRQAIEIAIERVDEPAADAAREVADDEAGARAGTPAKHEAGPDVSAETPASTEAPDSAQARVAAAADVAAETCGCTEPDVSSETRADARLSHPHLSPRACEAEGPDEIDALLDRIDGGPRVRAVTSGPARDSEHKSFGAGRADALQALAESYLAAETEPRGSVADRYQVVVHIDQRLLSRAPPHGRAHGRTGTSRALPLDLDYAASLDDEALRRCEIEGSSRQLAIETARRLACGSSLVGIVEGSVDDGHCEPLDVGRRTRAIPPALQRALGARDGGCRFPGCGRTRFTEGHHVVHWADGGETKLANLVTLCRYHHRLVHEGGFELEARDDCAERDRFVFRRPDGSRVEPNGRLPLRAGRVTRSDGVVIDAPACEDDDDAELPLFELNRQAGLEIDTDTSRSEWLGERMDHGTAIECMQYRRRHERCLGSVRYDEQRFRWEVEGAQRRAEARRRCRRCR